MDFFLFRFRHSSATRSRPKSSSSFLSYASTSGALGSSSSSFWGDLSTTTSGFNSYSGGLEVSVATFFDLGCVISILYLLALFLFAPTTCVLAAFFPFSLPFEDFEALESSFWLHSADASGYDDYCDSLTAFLRAAFAFLFFGFFS